MTESILERSKINREIIGTYRFEEKEDFWCGYIENYNDKILQMRYFNKFGFDDGILVEQIENIESIEYETDYENIFNYLVRKNNDLDNLPNNISFKDTETWKYDYLNEFKKNRRMVSVEFNLDYSVIGNIIELNEEEFIIRGFGKHGQDEGNTVYKIANITSFFFYNIEILFIEKLSAYRKSKI